MPPESIDPADIQLLCMDVDGVLTDGSIMIDDHGVETKRFHIRDGLAIKAWQKLGFQAAIITGRQGLAVRHRANEVGLRIVLQGVDDKRAAFHALLEQTGLVAEEAAMIGDDLPDLPIIRACGYPMAVADAAPEIRSLARYVTVRPGGHAAVREAIEHLLKAKERWSQVVSMYE